METHALESLRASINARAISDSTAIDGYQIVYFPSHFCREAAAAVAKRLLTRGQQAQAVDIDCALSRPASIKRLVLLHPILGDDRIPVPVEQLLLHPEFKPESHSLFMNGDFIESPPQNQRVAEEVHRLLVAKGSRAKCKPSWVDTPTSEIDAHARKFGDRVIAGDAWWPARLSRPVTKKDEVREAPLLDIARLLGQSPIVQVDAAGWCRGLELTDGAPYPRSLLTDGTQARQVLCLAAALPQLESLAIPFANIEGEIEISARVRRLDLRGNRFKDFAFLGRLPQLEWLNMAACDLPAVPEVLSNLRTLMTLLVHKNRLERLPDWLDQLTRLRRLSIYRNGITRLDASLGRCRSLTGLNLGANPVGKHLPYEIGDLSGLEQLGLRGVGLVKLPEWLQALPNLRFLDVSKNDCAGAAEQLLPRVHVTPHLPKWP